MQLAHIWHCQDTGAVLEDCPGRSQLSQAVVWEGWVVQGMSKQGVGIGESATIYQLV